MSIDTNNYTCIVLCVIFFVMKILLINEETNIKLVFKSKNVITIRHISVENKVLKIF